MPKHLCTSFALPSRCCWPVEQAQTPETRFLPPVLPRAFLAKSLPCYWSETLGSTPPAVTVCGCDDPEMAWEGGCGRVEERSQRWLHLPRLSCKIGSGHRRVTGRPPMIAAAYRGANWSLLRLLLQWGADPNIDAGVGHVPVTCGCLLVDVGLDERASVGSLGVGTGSLGVCIKALLRLWSL